MNDDAKRQKSPTFVPVCAIGASAGGVTALQGLFRHLPDDLGLAYVVILHLSPDQPSALSEILSICTRMPVLQIEDGPTLKRNCVFVIPPDRELVIEGDRIEARPFTEPRGRRAPIDMFFRSIAAARGDGIAMVLSGAGSDGTLGLRAVKEAGGVIMVQEPAEAGFGSMPQNAIATGDADFVAPLARLAERVAEVARSKEAVRSLDVDGSANDLRRIVAFLRARTGHDFSSYKRATVLRRVMRRMQVCGTDTLEAYADHLLTTPEETKELFSDLLISVTMFFRDPGAFAALERLVIGPLFDELDPSVETSIRAWVVGCATGEEAYSLAMLLLEEATRRKLHPNIQVFATDLDEGALATAREGRYPRTVEADIPEDRLARFFTNEGTHYRVRKELRDSVLFARHSAIKEPPFMRLDLVACRNLLIYLERSLQQQLCTLFHYGLKPGRFLFLGSAETADAAADLFVPLDREARIYGARPQGGQSLPVLPQFAASERFANPGQAILARPERPDLPGALHAAALERSAPPSALVDDGSGILHLSPSAGRFILPSEGPLSNLLPAVVRPELRLDLKVALSRALEKREPTLTLPVTIAMDGGCRRIAMHVIPSSKAAHTGAQALVLFLDGGAVPGGEQPDTAPDTRPDEVRRLHAELRASQEALVASRAGHETAMQDLRATNEELQSINEEYRSTAEELETSKEELQSINEELHTVNAELKSKLGSISVAHSDLQNLTAATEIGTLFLDSQLRIRMFTSPIADLFNITGADIGRRITDFTHRLEYDGLEADAHRVLRDLVATETEVRSKNGHWYVVRLRPYRTVEDRIDGTVVTFVDNTARRVAEAALRESEERFRQFGEASQDVLWTRNAVTFQWNYLTPAFETIYGLGREAALRGDNMANWLDLIVPEDREHAHASLRRVREGEWVTFEYRVQRPLDGEIRWVRNMDFPIRDASGEVVRIAGISHDVTELKRAEEALTAAELRQRALVEGIPQLVWRAVAEGEWTWASPQWTEFTGQPEAESRGWGWIDTLHPDDRDIARRAWATAAKVGGFETEYRIRQAGSDSYRWFQTRATPVRNGLGAIVEWLGTSNDIDDLRGYQERQAVLVAELQHRTRNLLGVVRSTADMTLRTSNTLDEFADKFRDRLAALARVQSLLSRLNEGERVTFDELIDTELSALGQTEGLDRVTLDGPKGVALRSSTVQTFAMAVHELATNAVKYGALKQPGGHLAVTWRLERQDAGGQPWLHVDWRESGVAMPAPDALPRGGGAGRSLIERALPYQLGAKTTYVMASEGVQCTISLPVSTHTAEGGYGLEQDGG